MRRLWLLGLSCALACGPVTVDDPFQTTTPEATTTGDPAESSSAADDPSASSGEPATTAATTTATTTGEMVDSGSSGGGPAVCGDGVQEGDELCDGEDFGEASCESEGYTAGTLTCSESCQGYATDGCFTCGNGLLEIAEQCDGPLAPAVTCETAGFTDGTIACDAVTCQFDTSGCTLCGDGVAEGNEVCDQDDLLGLGCGDLGFDGGTLACDAECSHDFTSCTGGNYTQDFEGGAIPSEFDSRGNAVWIAHSGNPIAGSWSAASGMINHNQTSNLTLAVNYVIAGTVAFTHEESSEANFDYLEFWIDGVMQQEWAGINAAQMASYPVAAGAHTFEWRYTKDGSVNTGSDRVWVDDIVLTGGVPTG